MQIAPVMLGEHLHRKQARERHAELGEPDTDDERNRTQLRRKDLEEVVDRHSNESSRAQTICRTRDYGKHEVREYELQQRGERIHTQQALRDGRNPPLDSRFHDRQIAARIHRDVDRRQHRHRRHVFAEGTRQARQIGADQGVAERRGDRSHECDARIRAAPPRRVRRRVGTAGQ